MAYPRITELVEHREPFLFVDRIVSVNGERGVFETRITASGNQRAGPRILLVEALAQSGAALMGLAARKRGDLPRPGMLVGLRNFEFLSDVLAGDVLTLEVECTRTMGNLVVLRGIASVDGRIAATGELVVSIG